MTIENKLKELILKRYNSIREFTIAIDMPYTTMDSLFKRGIATSNVSNIFKICKALHISADALADGKIAPSKPYYINVVNSSTEVTEILENTKDILLHDNHITLDGVPISQASIDSIIDAMDVGVEIAKRKK